MMIFKLNTPSANCNSGNITAYSCFSPLGLNAAPAAGLPISIPGLTAGDTYYAMIDGFAGAICDYKIGADFGVQLSVSVSPGNKDICLGGSVNLTADGGDGVYTWDASPDLTLTTGSTTTATPTTLGAHQYVVTGTASDPECPNSSDTATIYVMTTPTPNAGIDDSICLGQTVQLNGLISEPLNSTVWQVYAPGISNPNAQFTPNFSTADPVVTVNQAGVYYFIYRETSQLCGQFRDTVAVTVIDPVQVLNSVSPSCAGLSDGTITVANQYGEEYSFDNGVTWQTSPTMGGFAAGTYDVCSRNYLGCDVCSQVTVPEGPQISMSVVADTLICENGTANLAAYGSGGTSFTYHWGHTNDLAQSQLVTPSNQDDFTVQAENQGGCLSSVDSIYVNIRSGLTLSNSADTAVCPAETAYMQAIAADGSGEYITLLGLMDISF